MIVEAVHLRAGLLCETGLHLGNKEGGYAPRSLSAPVLQNPVLQIDGGFAPYIAATSIKGKLRNIAEILFEKELNFQFHAPPAEEGRPRIELWRHECDTGEQVKQCEVCAVFGAAGRSPDSAGQQDYPARLLFRNALLQGKVEPEQKTENTLKRLRREANPRTNERVPRGAVFGFEVVYFVHAGTENVANKYRDLANLVACLRFLETNYLGGSGSRGYGKLTFRNLELGNAPHDSLEALHRHLLKAQEVDRAGK